MIHPYSYAAFEERLKPAFLNPLCKFLIILQVRNQDAVFVLRGISREARETAWLWLKVMFFYSFSVFCLEQLEPA
jgi:hypothetical protein